MARPTFTWTVVPPNHLIRSVCDACTRLIGVTANRGLLHVIQSVHHCELPNPNGYSPKGLPPKIKLSVH